MALLWQGGALTSGSGSSTSGARLLMAHLLGTFSQARNGGIGRAGSPSWSAGHSLHYEGRAADVMVDHLSNEQRIAVGNAMVNYLVAHAEELGVQEITWNGYHWGYGNKWYWRPSQNNYGGRPDHWNHVHVGLNRQAASRTSMPALRAITVMPTFPGEGSSGVQPDVRYPGGVYPGEGAPGTVGAQTPEEFIRANYAYMSAFMNDPEIGPILRSAAEEGLSLELLYGRLSNTEWWKTKSESQRKWQALVGEDPATAARVRASKAAEVNDLAGRYGILLEGTQLADIVEKAIALDFSPQQLAVAIMDRAVWTEEGYVSGQLGAEQAFGSEMSAAYGVNIPTTTLGQWARDVVLGRMDQDGVRSILTEQARAAYAGNAAIQTALANGSTVLDVVGQARATVAGELEWAPDWIDIRDDRWKSLAMNPTGDGTYDVMDVNKARVTARQQDEYIQTAGARRKAAVGATGVLSALGLQ